jgi:hypothetical protein
MTEVAHELSDLPDAQSLSNRLWAEALSSSASSLAIAATGASPGDDIAIKSTE